MAPPTGCAHLFQKTCFGPVARKDLDAVLDVEDVTPLEFGFCAEILAIEAGFATPMSARAVADDVDDLVMLLPLYTLMVQSVV